MLSPFPNGAGSIVGLSISDQVPLLYNAQPFPTKLLFKVSLLVLHMAID